MVFGLENKKGNKMKTTEEMRKAKFYFHDYIFEKDESLNVDYEYIENEIDIQDYIDFMKYSIVK